jgi:hypothetical protein
MVSRIISSGNEGMEPSSCCQSSSRNSNASISANDDLIRDSKTRDKHKTPSGRPRGPRDGRDRTHHQCVVVCYCALVFHHEDDQLSIVAIDVY